MIFCRLLTFVVLLPLAWSIGERELLNKIKRAFDGVSAGVDASRAMERVFNTRFKQLLESKRQRAIGEGQVCEESLLSKYVDAQLARLSPAARETYWLLSVEGVDFWSFVVPLYSSKYTGFFPGERQGREFKKWMSVSQKFWDVPLSNVSLLPITGKVLTDNELLLPGIEWFYEVNRTQAQKLIDVTQEAMAKYPLLGPSFPLWSLNAMAIGSDPSFWPTFFVNLPVILMGDGLTMFLQSHRIAESGADFVLFHEQGHHIQFGLNITEFYNDSSPDQSRYIELLADAYGAYIAHHPRGASFQTNRIQQVSKAAFSVGDCNFDELGHHGTPVQRAMAVAFAAQLIDASKIKGRILKASEFKAKFDAFYPNVIAPAKV